MRNPGMRLILVATLAFLGFTVLAPVNPASAHTGEITFDCGGPTLHAHDFPVGEHTVTITAVPGNTVNRSFTSDSNGYGQSWVSWTDLGVSSGSVNVTYSWNIPDNGSGSAEGTFDFTAECDPDVPPTTEPPTTAPPTTQPTVTNPPTTAPPHEPPTSSPPSRPTPSMSTTVTTPIAPPATPVVAQPNFTG